MNSARRVLVVGALIASVSCLVSDNTLESNRIAPIDAGIRHPSRAGALDRLSLHAASSASWELEAVVAHRISVGIDGE